MNLVEYEKFYLPTGRQLHFQMITSIEMRGVILVLPKPSILIVKLKLPRGYILASVVKRVSLTHSDGPVPNALTLLPV